MSGNLSPLRPCREEISPPCSPTQAIPPFSPLVLGGGNTVWKRIQSVAAALIEAPPLTRSSKEVRISAISRKEGQEGRDLGLRAAAKRQFNSPSENSPRAKRTDCPSPGALARKLLPHEQLNSLFDQISRRVSIFHSLKSHIKKIKGLFEFIFPSLPHEEKIKFIDSLETFLKDKNPSEDQLVISLSVTLYYLSRDEVCPKCPLDKIGLFRVKEIEKEVHALLEQQRAHYPELPSGAEFYLKTTLSRMVVLPCKQFNPMIGPVLKYLFDHLQLKEIGMSVKQIQALYRTAHNLTENKDLLDLYGECASFSLSARLEQWVRMAMRLPATEPVRPIHGIWAITSLLFSFTRQEEYHPLCYAVATHNDYLYNNPALMLKNLFKMFQSGKIVLNAVEYNIEPSILCPPGLLNFQAFEKVDKLPIHSYSLQRAMKTSGVIPESAGEALIASGDFFSSLDPKTATYLKMTHAGFCHDLMEGLSIGWLTFIAYNSLDQLSAERDSLEIDLENLEIDKIRGWVRRSLVNHLKLKAAEKKKLFSSIKASLFLMYSPLELSLKEGNEGKELWLSSGFSSWKIDSSKGLSLADLSFYQRCFSLVVYIDGRWHEVYTYTQLTEFMTQIAAELFPVERVAGLAVKLEQDKHKWKEWLKRNETHFIKSIGPQHDGCVQIETNGNCFPLLTQLLKGKEKIVDSPIHNFFHFLKYLMNFTSAYPEISKTRFSFHIHDCILDLEMLRIITQRKGADARAHLKWLWKHLHKEWYESLIPPEKRIAIATLIQEITLGTFLTDLVFELQNVKKQLSWKTFLLRLQKEPVQLYTSTIHDFIRRQAYLVPYTKLQNFNYQVGEEIKSFPIQNFSPKLVSIFDLAATAWRQLATKQASPPSYESILLDLFIHCKLPPLIPLIDLNYPEGFSEFSQPKYQFLGVNLTQNPKFSENLHCLLEFGSNFSLIKESQFRFHIQISV